MFLPLLQKFVLEFCRQVQILKKEIPDLIFSTPNGIRMNRLDREVLTAFKQAGWEALTIAPESGSEKTLKAMKKQINTQEICDYAFLIKQFGFKLFGFFIIGYPGETIADVKQTIKFACKLPFDYITFSAFTPLPGTPVFDRLLATGEISEAYVPGNYFKPTYAPPTIGQKKMNWLYKLALIRSIVLSPRRFWFVLRNYSFRRLFNYGKAIFFH